MQYYEAVESYLIFRTITHLCEIREEKGAYPNSSSLLMSGSLTLVSEKPLAKPTCINNKEEKKK